MTMMCSDALEAEDKQHSLCQQACKKAEKAYSRACSKIEGGKELLQAQQALNTFHSQVLQVSLNKADFVNAAQDWCMVIYTTPPTLLDTVAAPSMMKFMYSCPQAINGSKRSRLLQLCSRPAAAAQSQGYLKS